VLPDIKASPISMSFHNIITQTDKPKPVPCPVGLVVKKGWKIFSFMFSGIPLPLSATLISKLVANFGGAY
jgi:hypothetical protein